MTNRDEIKQSVDEMLAGWFDGERYDVDRNDIIELVMKHCAGPTEPVATVAVMGVSGVRVLIPHPPGSADRLPIGTKLYAAPPAVIKPIIDLIKEYSEDAMPDSDYRLACNDLVEAVSAVSAQVQDVAGWQDISTAPRDGTTVLLYAPGWGSPKTGWTYGEDDWQDCPYSHKGNEDYLPTHWMSLPQHPQSRRAAHEDFV